MSRKILVAASSVAIATTAVMGLAGCDGKTKQCNQLIDVIKKEKAPLEQAAGDDPAELKKLAETLGNVAEKVEAVKVKDKSLAKLRDDYATMVRDLAKASTDTAAAIEDNDATKTQEAVKTISGFGSRETDLVDNINTYCSSS